MHRKGHPADGITGGRQIVCPPSAYKFEMATGKPMGNDCGTLSGNGDILLSYENQH